MRHAFATALALAAAGCSAPAPSVRLERLLPRLGPSTLVDRDGDTRPAVVLDPGGPLACDVRLEAGSVLALGLALREATVEGSVLLRVLLDGSEIAARRFTAARLDRWRQVRVPVPRGARRLELRAEAQGPVLVGAPRVYVPDTGRKRRVLVWLSQDTVRADHLTPHGYGRDTSPEFQRLARESVVFENAVATSSWTLPSLASQFTSRYPTFHGATGRTTALPDEPVRVFDVLASSGFTVLGVVANRFAHVSYGMTRGFDVSLYTPRRADFVNGLVERVLDEWSGGDLALFVHYMDPHHTYKPPPPFDDRFTAPYAGTLDGTSFPDRAPESVTPEDVAHVVGLYDGEVAFTDEQIGRLLAALRVRRLLDDAVVVYSADHGEEFLEHGLWLHNRTLYQETLHVPLAIRVPGMPPRRVPDVVSGVDLAPTILDALGLGAPQSFQGRSLMLLLRGGSLAERPVFSETELHPDGRHRVAVRDGRRKYLLVAPAGREIPDRVDLGEAHDLVADPGERRPLPAGPEVERLHREALAFLARARAEGARGAAAQLSPEAEAELRALGYIQ